MNLCNIGHTFDYEIEKLIRLFLPFEKIQVFHTVEKSENCAICTLYDEGGKTFAKAQLYLNEKSAEFITEVDYTAKDIKKEIVAFANSGGGNIYIGITDTGEVTGVDNIKESIESLSGMIREGIKSDLTLYTKINIEKINDKDIILIKFWSTD